MVPELFHHCKPKDVLVIRVNENVNSYQTCEEFALMLEHEMNISS